MSIGVQIVKKILIETEITNTAPLSIASGKTDDITDVLVVKDKKGNAFIPATSIAGVLRAAIANVYDENIANFIFGGNNDKDTQSIINISDVVMRNSKIVFRDGVALDSYSGTARNGAKYNYEAIERGAIGKLCLEFTVRGEHLKKAANVLGKDEGLFEEVAVTIANIIASGIGFGGKTAKGFGKVNSVEECMTYVFDFEGAKDTLAWIEYLESGTLPKHKYITDKKNPFIIDTDFKLEADFEIKNSILIRASYLGDDFSEEEYGLSKNHSSSNKVNAIQMSSGGDYVIPGTTIKGVIRNEAIKILSNLSNYKHDKVDEFINELMGYSIGKKAKKSSLNVDETYILKDDVYAIPQTRNRINRFTGGTIGTALFTEIPIWRKKNGIPVVKISCSIKNCTKAQAGLMLLILREIWMGNLCFGGGKAVGRGSLVGVQAKINFKGKKYLLMDNDGNFIKETDRSELESYVNALVGEMDG